MTHDDLIAILNQRFAQAGGVSRFAQQNHISHPYLCEVVNGHQPPGPAILDLIGVRRVPTYEPLAGGGKTMTHTQLLKHIEKLIQEAGTQTELARRLNVAHPYLSMVRKRRQAPGPKLLRALGLRRVVVYEPLDINATHLHRYGLCDCGQRATSLLSVRIRNRRETIPLCDDCAEVEKN